MESLLPQAESYCQIVDVSSGDTPDVAALTRRLVAGDEMAYRIFYEAYFDRLSRYLLVVARGNEEPARDALQETFTRVVRHIRVFANEEVFWSWLTVLARSALFDAGRKRRRYLAFLDRFTRHTMVVARAAEEVSSSDERLRELLERNMSLLPSDERRLLESKYFERKSVRELAAELQTTEKSVESHLVRIRRKLKHAMLAQLNDEPLV